MGVDVADFENSGAAGVAITNFDNEMVGLYRAAGKEGFADIATRSGVGLASKDKLGFGCVFFDANLDGLLDLAIANGHIDETVRNIRGNVGYAQPPQLFLNSGNGMFADVASSLGGGFNAPKVGRGLAYADFDQDGDLDLLVTTNNGPAYLYRNDQLAGNRSIRFRLVGTKSNRDAIGATVQIFYGGESQSRMVKSGSSYLSQSELPLTFGIGKRDKIDRAVVQWPGGRTEEFKNFWRDPGGRAKESASSLSPPPPPPPNHPLFFWLVGWFPSSHPPPPRPPPLLIIKLLPPRKNRPPPTQSLFFPPPRTPQNLIFYYFSPFLSSVGLSSLFFKHP